MYSADHQGVITEAIWSFDELGIDLSAHTRLLSIAPPGPIGSASELKGFYFRQTLAWLLICYRGYPCALRLRWEGIASERVAMSGIIRIRITNHSTQEREELVYTLKHCDTLQISSVLQRQGARYPSSTDLAAEYHVIENIVPVSFMFFVAGLPRLPGR